MNVELATWIVNLALLYVGIGVVFGLAFVTVGAGRIDPNAATGTWGFRLLILPGSAALWPFLIVLWRRAGQEPEERCNPHRRAARGGPA